MRGSWDEAIRRPWRAERRIGNGLAMLPTRATTLASRTEVGEGWGARGCAVDDAVAVEYGEGTSPAQPGSCTWTYISHVLGCREMM